MMGNGICADEKAMLHSTSRADTLEPTPKLSRRLKLVCLIFLLGGVTLMTSNRWSESRSIGYL
jgi:hypothetical protein